jgi:large subunit ribosomal protein L28
MAKCAFSGRKTSFGNTKSHANNSSRRTWKPNVHRHRIYDAATGTFVTFYVSAKALRTLTKHRLRVGSARQTQRG